MTKKTEMRTVSRWPFGQSVDFELTRMQSKTGGILQGKGWALDISLNGLGFISDIPLEAGEILRLNFPSHPNGFSIPVFSEVQWAKSEDNGYRVGIQYIS